MEHTDFAKYFNYCVNKLHIKIYPVTTGQNATVKIAVNKNGIESVGEKYYSTTPKADNVKYWQVIENLYKRYYELNYKPTK